MQAHSPAQQPKQEFRQLRSAVSLSNLHYYTQEHSANYPQQQQPQQQRPKQQIIDSNSPYYVPPLPPLPSPNQYGGIRLAQVGFPAVQSPSTPLQPSSCIPYPPLSTSSPQNHSYQNTRPTLGPTNQLRSISNSAMPGSSAAPNSASSTSPTALSSYSHSHTSLKYPLSLSTGPSGPVPKFSVPPILIRSKTTLNPPNTATFSTPPTLPNIPDLLNAAANEETMLSTPPVLSLKIHKKSSLPSLRTQFKQESGNSFSNINAISDVDDLAATFEYPNSKYSNLARSTSLESKNAELSTAPLMVPSKPIANKLDQRPVILQPSRSNNPNTFSPPLANPLSKTLSNPSSNTSDHFFGDLGELWNKKSDEVRGSDGSGHPFNNNNNYNSFLNQDPQKLLSKTKPSNGILRSSSGRTEKQLQQGTDAGQVKSLSFKKPAQYSGKLRASKSMGNLSRRLNNINDTQMNRVNAEAETKINTGNEMSKTSINNGVTNTSNSPNTNIRISTNINTKSASSQIGLGVNTETPGTRQYPTSNLNSTSSSGFPSLPTVFQTTPGQAPFQSDASNYSYPLSGKRVSSGTSAGSLSSAISSPSLTSPSMSMSSVASFSMSFYNNTGKNMNNINVYNNDINNNACGANNSTISSGNNNTTNIASSGYNNWSGSRSSPTSIESTQQSLSRFSSDGKRKRLKRPEITIAIPENSASTGYDIDIDTNSNKSNNNTTSTATTNNNAKGSDYVKTTTDTWTGTKTPTKQETKPSLNNTLDLELPQRLDFDDLSPASFSSYTPQYFDYTQPVDSPLDYWDIFDTCTILDAIPKSATDLGANTSSDLNSVLDPTLPLKQRSRSVTNLSQPHSRTRATSASSLSSKTVQPSSSSAIQQNVLPEMVSQQRQTQNRNSNDNYYYNNDYNRIASIDSALQYQPQLAVTVNARHYSDRVVEEKLRLLASSEEKFDEVMEFGFPKYLVASDAVSFSDLVNRPLPTQPVLDKTGSKPTMDSNSNSHEYASHYSSTSPPQTPESGPHHGKNSKKDQSKDKKHRHLQSGGNTSEPFSVSSSSPKQDKLDNSSVSTSQHAPFSNKNNEFSPNSFSSPSMNNSYIIGMTDAFSQSPQANRGQPQYQSNLQSQLKAQSQTQSQTPTKPQFGFQPQNSQRANLQPSPTLHSTGSNSSSKGPLPSIQIPTGLVTYNGPPILTPQTGSFPNAQSGTFPPSGTYQLSNTLHPPSGNLYQSPGSYNPTPNNPFFLRSTPLPTSGGTYPTSNSSLPTSGSPQHSPNLQQLGDPNSPSGSPTSQYKSDSRRISPIPPREMTLKFTLTPASMRANEAVLYGWIQRSNTPVAGTPTTAIYTPAVSTPNNPTGFHPFRSNADYSGYSFNENDPEGIVSSGFGTSNHMPADYMLRQSLNRRLGGKVGGPPMPTKLNTSRTNEMPHGAYGFAEASSNSPDTRISGSNPVVGPGAGPSHYSGSPSQGSGSVHGSDNSSGIGLGISSSGAGVSAQVSGIAVAPGVVAHDDEQNQGTAFDIPVGGFGNDNQSSKKIMIKRVFGLLTSKKGYKGNGPTIITSDDMKK